MKKTRKILLWVLIPAIIIGAIVFYFKNKKQVVEYTTAEAQKIDLVRTVSVTGTVNPDQQIDMSFKTTGILKDITVDVGDYVKKGQKLATIDTGTLFSQLRASEAQIRVQEQTYENMKRHRKIFTQDQRDAQRAMVEQSKASADVIRDQLSDVNLIAPFDGIITKRNASPAETVVLSLNSPVLSIIKKDDLLIEANIPESDISKIVLGQIAKVTLDALDEEDVFKATVFKIDPASTIIQGVVYYRIKLKFENLDERFKAGMSANLDIITAEKNNIITVPSRAIKMDGNKKYVDILQSSENITKKSFIETGLSGDDGMVEVIKGLNEGEKVVTFISEK